MRKITQEAANAFRSKKSFRKTNTQVISDAQVGSSMLYLHGNLIATHYKGKLEFTLAGWPTRTTIERLKGLGINIVQRDYVCYLETIWSNFPEHVRKVGRVALHPSKWYNLDGSEYKIWI